MPASETLFASSTISSLSASLSSVPPTLAATDSWLFSPADLATSPLLLAPDPVSTSLRLLTSLFMVILLIFALSWFLQRRAGLGSSVFGKTLGVIPIDSRRFVYLMEILGRVYILGVTESQISLISEVTDKTTLDALKMQSSPSVSPVLSSLFGFLRRSKKPSDEVDSDDLRRHAETAERFRDKLSQMVLRREDHSETPPPPPPTPPEPR